MLCDGFSCASLALFPPCFPAATQLGATLSDRLRVNVTWAVRGLYRSADGGPPQFVGGLQSRLRCDAEQLCLRS